MANKETMREIGHYFGIGLSTVHGVLQRVNTAINDSMSNVRAILYVHTFTDVVFILIFKKS
jgi:hypothetical protein